MRAHILVIILVFAILIKVRTTIDLQYDIAMHYCTNQQVRFLSGSTSSLKKIRFKNIFPRSVKILKNRSIFFFLRSSLILETIKSGPSVYQQKNKKKNKKFSYFEPKTSFPIIYFQIFKDGPKLETGIASQISKTFQKSFKIMICT